MAKTPKPLALPKEVYVAWSDATGDTNRDDAFLTASDDKAVMASEDGAKPIGVYKLVRVVELKEDKQIIERELK